MNFPVATGGSFVIFATDYFNRKFVAGTTLALTVTFTDDSVAAASAAVPIVPTVGGITPAGGVQGTTVPVTVSGTNFQSGATLSVGAGVTVTGVTVPSRHAAPGDAHARRGRGGGAAGRDGDEPGRGRGDAWRAGSR